ncbi:MAG: DUF3576 domain-containing protein [Hydrotalea sp.]|nr:DUF3576 domain-containing protein [Hydrotalea sp.]
MPVCFLALAMAGCGGKAITGNAVPNGDADQKLIKGNTNGVAFSGDIFSRVNRDADNGTSNGVVVNPYLWRASLETVAFMPMAQVDPIGGVVITDWASIPSQQNQNERYKINIFIFGPVLRADAVRVKVFKQTLSGSTWRDTAVPADMANKLELAILTRARQIKIAATQQ